MLAAVAILVAALIGAGATVWAARIAKDVRQIKVSINGRLDRLLLELHEVEQLVDVHPEHQADDLP